MSLEKQKIIIVEDDPDHADLIIDVLEEEEIEMGIVLLKDGKEAIDYFQNGSINCNGDDVVQSQTGLVILDLNLPKVSGMDILKFLKSNSKYSSMNVIILSTSSDYETIAEAYKNGANGYLTKPISYEDFVEKVKLLKEYWLDTDKLPVYKTTHKGGS